MKGASILILGVGRSGTTAMYSLLQSLIDHKFEDDARYCYEPFLWDSTKLPRHASEFGDQFDYMRALSAIGIHHHLQLPILATSKTSYSASARTFLTTITRCPADKPALLTKLIRATGRSALLRRTSPRAKIILLIRNPIDVVNSIVNMFSLYGDEFHESDFVRFRREVTTLYPTEADLFPCGTRAEREAYYWYFTNLHFLRTSARDPLVKVVVYEQYVEDRANTLADICAFLDLSLTEYAIDQSARPVGWVSDANLTAREIDRLQPYAEAYRSILLPGIAAESTAVDDLLDRDRATLNRVSDIREQRDDLRGRGPLFLIDEVIRANLKKNEYIKVKERLASVEDMLTRSNHRERELSENLSQSQTKVRNLTDLNKTTSEDLSKAVRSLTQAEASIEQAQTETGELRILISDLQAQKQSTSAYLLRLSTAFEELLPISFWRNPIKKFRAYRKLAIVYATQKGNHNPDTEDKL